MEKGAEDLIDCKDLSLGYEGRMVLRGLNFSVRRGDYLCILGENGSGKSTLLKGLLGLLRPAAGAVVFNPELKRTDRGYLPQEAAAKKDFPASVHEIVLSGFIGRMGLRPFYTRREKEEAGEVMQLLGIAELRNRSYRELSGGQQRRVLIGRALCGGQRLLALDEPAAGLDPLVSADLYRLLNRINRDRGIAIVMVSHDVEAAAANAKRILHLKHFPAGNSGGNSADSFSAEDLYFFGDCDEYIRSGPGKQFLQRGGGQ